MQAVCPLNVIGVGNRASQKLNRAYRNTDKPASVLTFPPDNKPAEIYLNMHHAQKTAREEGISVTERVIFLYLHALLHLLGHKHGPRMESLEDEYATTYMYEAKEGKRRCRRPQ